jgi:phosphate-selective porin
VTGEFIHVQEARTKQGLRGEDLPDLLSRGWYLSGAWVVLGKKRPDQGEPSNNFPLHGNLGAVEIGTRIEQIRFSSTEHPGRPSRSLRAANVLPNSDRAVTFGVNWYMNRFMKVQFNFVREKIEDVQRTPLEGLSLYWTRMVRMQFVM